MGSSNQKPKRWVSPIYEFIPEHNLCREINDYQHSDEDWTADYTRVMDHWKSILRDESLGGTCFVPYARKKAFNSISSDSNIHRKDTIFDDGRYNIFWTSNAGIDMHLKYANTRITDLHHQLIVANKEGKSNPILIIKYCEDKYQSMAVIDHSVKRFLYSDLN